MKSTIMGLVSVQLAPSECLMVPAAHVPQEPPITNPLKFAPLSVLKEPSGQLIKINVSVLPIPSISVEHAFDAKDMNYLIPPFKNVNKFVTMDTFTI